MIRNLLEFIDVVLDAAIVRLTDHAIDRLIR